MSLVVSLLAFAVAYLIGANLIRTADTVAYQRWGLAVMVLSTVGAGCAIIGASL